MENRNNERLIYLKDLIFAVLYRWKGLIAVALIFALLLGGYKAVTGLSSAPAVAEPDKEAVTAYEQAHAFLTGQKESLEQRIAAQQDFLSNALIMKLDPYNHYLLTMRYYIHTDYQIQPDKAYQTPDIAPALFDSYWSVITGNTGLSAVAEALDTTPSYIYGALTGPGLNNDNILSVCFYTDSQESAEKAQFALEQQLDMLANQLMTTIGAHTLQPLECSISAHADSTIFETQTIYTEQLKQMEASLEEVTTKLSQLNPPMAVTLSSGSALKSAVVFAVAGAVLGVFVSVLAIWLCHIGSGKVYSLRTLDNRTGVKLIGCMAVKLPTNPIDRKLLELENRELNDPEAQAAMLAVSIRNRAADAKGILLTGDGKDNDLLVQALTAAMPGVTLLQADILNGAAGLEALAACDAVVLTEQCGVSRYDRVNRRCELVADHGKQLIGCVLLNG